MANQNFRVKNGLEVGTGVTISAGVVTASSFVGSGSQLTNITANYSNVSGVSSSVVGGGVSATSLSVVGVSTFDGAIKIRNGYNLNIGDNNDLRIYHDGTDSRIEETGSGSLYISGSDINIQQDSTNKNFARFVGGGAAELYYNDNKKLSTSGIGVTITGTLVADQINVSGIITATAFHTGAEGSAIRITSNTISGPANLIIDPAAVGDDTGAVRIKGDLFVDGTQFVVNSTTIELADFNVGIATTVGTNLILDGAGIGIGSANIRKTFVYDDASNTLQSSIGLGVTVGGDFKTGTDSVLNRTTLGPTVVNSSLTSVGTLSSLNVSGIATVGTVKINSGIVTATSGITTFYGDASNTVSGRWTLGADGTSNYTFTGIGFTQTTNDPTLYLKRGEIYEFVNNSGGSHPFEIRVGPSSDAYNNGVTNNGSATGIIRFEVPHNTPDTLYYQCTSHPNMGGRIEIVDNSISINLHNAATYTLTVSDIGGCIREETSGANITVPADIFIPGDAITIFNVSSGNNTITQGVGVTMYNGADGTTGNRTLAAKGIATILCTTNNEFVISGAQLT